MKWRYLIVDGDDLLGGTNSPELASAADESDFLVLDCRSGGGLDGYPVGKLSFEDLGLIDPDEEESEDD
jgi:hypothetical protein